MIKIRVYGTPAPQGSKKHVGKGRMVESSKLLPAWRKAIKETIEAEYDGEPLDQPLSVEADFFIPKPAKPMFDEPATPADLDKLLRALGDGMEAGGLVKNDARITHWNATKNYATDDFPPGVEIRVYEQGENG